MNAKKSVPQRLGRVLEAVTRQSGRLRRRPEYGSWLLGKVSESQRRRRVRIQIILTAFVVVANLIGIAVASLVVTVVFPIPSVFEPEVRWLTFGVVPAYIATALVIGVVWATRRVIRNVRWAIEERTPTRTDQRNTFFAPWRLTRVLLVLWGIGTALITTLYGLVDTNYIPKFLAGHQFQRHRRLSLLLPVHRVRVAAGSGARRRGAGCFRRAGDARTSRGRGIGVRTQHRRTAQ